MTWQNPKTDWVTNPKPPTGEDFNRIEGNIDFLKEEIENKKGAIVEAINDMNQPATIADTYAQLANKIRDISKDATAAVGDVLSGKTFYQGGVKRTGTMPYRTGHVTAQSRSRSGTTLRFRPQPGYYDGSSGNSVQYSDSNFKASNIREGVSIFGLTGTLQEGVKMAHGTIRSEPDEKTIGGWAYVAYVRFNMSILGFRPAVIFFCEVGGKIKHSHASNRPLETITKAIWYDKYVAYYDGNPSVLYNSMQVGYSTIRWFDVPYSTGIVEIPVYGPDRQYSWVAFSEYPPLNHIS